LDLELSDNLQHVLAQQYPQYRVRFVVESADDPACSVIKELTAQATFPCELLIAGGCTDSGQKVHNLRHATADLPENVDVLVFFDSDARPAPNAVARLVDQCCRGGPQVATGYRWLVPRRLTFANLTLASINAATASLFKHHGWNLIWGGCWAVTRELFESTTIADAWRGTLSDDLVASRAMRLAGVRIIFEPGCMTASPIDFTWKEAAAFLRRQFLICRCYAPLWWWTTFPLMVLQPLVLFGGGVLAWLLAREGSAFWFWPLLISGTLYALSVLRGHWRQAVWSCRVQGAADALRAAARFDRWAAPWSCLFAVGVMLTSTFGRSMVWRNIFYHIGPAGRITLLGRSPTVEQHRAMVSANAKRLAQKDAGNSAAAFDANGEIVRQVSSSIERTETTDLAKSRRVA
jgi:cellulose synthase/poly-beta-1,6-N-acetylglucosamine synthase-like glycosyltransferase